MALDADAAFELLRQTYGSGLLDRLVAAADQTLDRTMRESRLDMGDLLALLDSVSLETLLRVEETAGSFEPAQAAAWLAAETADPGAGERLAGAFQLYLRRAVAGADLACKSIPPKRNDGEV